MTTFAATVDSEADVNATREAVWKVLTDPAAVARMTPLLKTIDDQGPTWVWKMTRVEALGVGITPCFTERMSFEEGKRITFTHAPPAGSKERVSVQGSYDLADKGDGSHLAISLTVTADLPLPKVATPAVKRVMKQTMLMMGERFAKNLLRELQP